MASKVLQRFAWAAVLVGGVAAFVASADATRPVRRTSRPSVVRGFNLFAGATNVVMNVNRVQCNVNTIGETCVDPTNSPSIGGGFWPKGSPNQYIFNGGLQISGIMGGTGHGWVGDTVGAFFFDPRGNQNHGEGLTNVLNGLVASDVAEWPSAAYIRDTSLFASGSIGRKTVSQQDTWVRYWDGNTNLSSGRVHPMGLLVEQRGLAWNFPSGNEDIIYFLYRFINITSNQAADYAGLADYGYDAASIAEIAALGAQFNSRMEAVYNVDLPDAGIAFHDMYAAFAQDPDVGNASANFSNANLVFSLGFAYKSDFLEPTWLYPPSINGAPFSASPGFEGVKYLKSPVNPATGNEFGISVFTNTTNSATFPDRIGVQALWRLMSGNLTATDGTCSVPRSQVPIRRFCQLVQTQDDTRFVQSSGPFTLNPGESAVIVVAYVHAAPVASMSCTAADGACPGGAWSLTPFINPPASGRMVPGLPVEGRRLLNPVGPTQDTLRNVDRAAGWISHADVDADTTIEQSEVNVVPRSLYSKALVAQAVFDAKFLLPFAPEQPDFYLLAGDNRVTVVWQPSATETDGDPYFAIASQEQIGGVDNALFDPNFREFDVEGYRIWRGRTEAEMSVIASFDYAGTTINDYTGAFVTATSGNQCAPELGIFASCDAAFDTANFTVANPIPLSGNVVQVPPGGRVELADGTVFIVTADTAVTGGGAGFNGLTDTGVPFVFEDRTVRNGFRYFYAVTAFDVNSVASGPSSLESPLVTKSVTPRAASANPVNAEVYTIAMVGDDGTVLDPTAPYPAINANGTLAGPIPPANTGELEFLAFAPELLPPGDYFARIDSMSPGCNGQAFCGDPTVYVSFVADTTFSAAAPTHSATFSAAVGTTVDWSVSSPLVKMDPTAGATFGIPATFAGRMPVQFSSKVVPLAATGAMISVANGRYGAAGTNRAARFLLHSYWYNEGGAPPANPTITPFPSAANNSGALTGVDTIYHPAGYWQPTAGGAAGRSVNAFFRYHDAAAAAVWYPGDFRVTWNADSTITLRDLTHRVTLPFRTTMTPGWGFINRDTVLAYGITTGDLADGTGTVTTTSMSYHYAYAIDAACQAWAIGCAPLASKARLEPLDLNADGTADANGFVLVVNGEPFFMSLDAIPAAGTQWHLTATGGGTLDATCDAGVPGSGDITPATAPTTCTYASYTAPANRPALAPGLRYRIQVTSPRSFDVASSGNLDNIHTVPDPYYVTNALEVTANTKVLRFVNLPHQAIIRIYSTSGILVNLLTHNDAAGGGEATWNLRNRNNQFVASGVYFYHVETPDGREKIGRFTVVNFAQ